MINTSAQNVMKNSTYNLISYFLPVITVIFFTPIIISGLGIKEYGVYIFLSTVITFLSLLDLGVSVANSKHIIEYYTEKKTDSLKQLIYSMNSVYLILAFIYLIVCLSTGFIIQLFVQMRPDNVTNYFLLFAIVGVTSFVGTAFGNFYGIFVTLQRYDLSAKISMTFFILSNVSMLILAVCGYKLVPILLAQLLLVAINSLVCYCVAHKIFPIMELKYKWVRDEILKNYKFGISVAFNNIANSSLVHFDKLLIPIFSGQAQLTYYGVPGGISNRISQLSNTLSSLLFPVAVSLNSLNDKDKIKRIYIRSLRLITILSAAIGLSIIFMADKLLFYWVGNDFAEKSYLVLILLVLTNFVLSIFSPLSNLLMATNRMKFLTTGSVIMAVINLIALFVLLPARGINGAAIAYFISVLPVYFMFYFAERKYFGISHLREHLKLYLKIFITAVPFFAIEFFLLYPLINSFLSVIIIGPICILLFLLLYKLFGFIDPEDWNDFKIFFHRLLVKFKLLKAD